VSAMSERNPLFPQDHDLWRNLCKSTRNLPHVRHRQRQWSASEYKTHPTSRLYQRRLDRGVGVLQTVLEGSVLGAFEPVGSFPFNAAISPTSSVRSRTMSLVTSFGSCGPIPPMLRALR
jgi:hypothetical protein